MEWRTKLGALLGAGGLVMLAAATTVAAPPTYSIHVTKSASPEVVPPSGASVLYTITVTPTGTGFFNVVLVDDGMAGCTLAGPTGDDADGKLEPGETWSYTCTVTGVTPGAQNTVIVNACHDQSECVSSHDATDNDSVTVGEGSEPPSQAPSEPPSQAPSEPPSQAPSDPPSQDPGTFTPSQNAGDATEPATDTVLGNAGTSRADDRAWLLVVALGLLLGSVVLLTPARPVRQRL